MRDYVSGDLAGAAYMANDGYYDDDRPTRAEAERDEYEEEDDNPEPT